MTLNPFSLRHSIAGKILIVTVGITTVLLASILFLVNRQGTAQIERNIDDNLQHALSVFLSLQERRLISLRDQASNVSTDYRLRSTLQLGDFNTIRAAQTDLSETYEYDFLWVLSNDGQVIAGDQGNPPKEAWFTGQSVIMDAKNGFDSAGLWAVGNQIYEVAASPVLSAEQISGLLVVGNRIDNELLDNIQSLTGASFIVLADNEVAAASTGSSLDSANVQRIAQASANGPSAPMRLEMQGEDYVAQTVSVSNVRGELLGTLLARQSWDEAIAPLRSLQTTLLGIGLASLLATLIAGTIMVSRLAAPIQRLVATAQSIGKGQYDTAIEVTSDDEIGHLAREFDDMRLSLKDAQERLIRSERLSIVGRMAGSIIHDFKQPISSIYGYSDLLSIETDEDKRKKYSSVIRKEIDRMLAMVNQLLDFARGEAALSLQPVRVDVLLLDTVESFKPTAQAAGVEITLTSSTDAVVSIDPQRMRRVLDNLLRNALEACPTAGRVILVSEMQLEMVQICISDNGPGIPAEIQADLFEAFVTAGKPNGTGLGLAVVKQIVEAHRGSIRFETSPTTGTSFFIELPA